jgi:hypothetical protein
MIFNYFFIKKKQKYTQFDFIHMHSSKQDEFGEI